MEKFVLLMHSARSKPMDFTLVFVGLVITFQQRNGRGLVKVLTSRLVSNIPCKCDRITLPSLRAWSQGYDFYGLKMESTLALTLVMIIPAPYLNEWL